MIGSEVFSSRPSRSRVGCCAFCVFFVKRIAKFIRTFVLPLKIALPAGVLGFIVKTLDLEYDFLRSFMPASDCYKALNLAITFMVVFHTSHSYGRFMSGITLMYQMLGELHETVALLVCFSSTSGADVKKIKEFQHTLVRLFSLQFMSCLAELEDTSKAADGRTKAHSYDLVDPDGLDSDTLAAIHLSSDTPGCIYNRILHLMMQAYNDQVISVPAPLFTRCFQEMGNAMIKFHESLKFKDTPFPAPYMALTDVLLMVHWVFTPFMVSMWTEGRYGAGCWSFVLVCSIWALHGTAEELDNPFNEAASEFDAELLLSDFNFQLVCMTNIHSPTAPGLKTGYRHDLHAARARDNSQRMMKPSPSRVFGVSFAAAVEKCLDKSGNVCQDFVQFVENPIDKISSLTDAKGKKEQPTSADNADKSNHGGSAPRERDHNAKSIGHVHKVGDHDFENAISSAQRLAYDVDPGELLSCDLGLVAPCVTKSGGVHRSTPKSHKSHGDSIGHPGDRQNTV